MIKYLIEKEFKQIFRNSFVPRMIVGYPFVMLLVMPWAANFEIKNIKLSVVDHDRSPYSTRMIEKIGSSGYFGITETAVTYQQALTSIENDRTDILLEIPHGFERDLVREQKAKVFIAANTVNGTKGSLGSSYLTAIVNDYAADVRQQLLQEQNPPPLPVIETVPQIRFNPHLDYKIYMVPALMVMILTMLCGFLPALNIVAEKEAGTMEQINVTPVPKFTFILSKLIPHWIIGLVVITIGFLVALVLYGLVPAGHLGTIYFFAVVYILAVSGMGLVISNYSGTMQQAMFVMFFFVLIMILVSGLFTPIDSMPQWAQLITALNPLRYFMEVMRMVYLKGSGIVAMKYQLTALLAFAVLFNLWAVLSYKKSS